MIRPSFVGLLAVLLVAGCRDARQDLAREHLRTHVPDGFALVAEPKVIPLADAPDGTATGIVSARYRVVRPTVEIRNGLDLPRGRELAAQLTALRGWALGALPAGDAIREEILATTARARAAFPVKRIVTPAGTEVDALVTIQIRKVGPEWQVASFKADAIIPGAPDSAVPLENSPETAAHFEQLAATVQRMDTLRRESLAARDRRAAQSLAALRAQMRTGRTFTSLLPDGRSARLVIGRGLETDRPAVVVITVPAGDGESFARFVGTPVQQPSGETIWRAVQVTTLSAPPDSPAPALTDSAARPVLTLFATLDSLQGQLETGGRKPRLLDLRPAGTADLIPDSFGVAPDR